MKIFENPLVAAIGNDVAVGLSQTPKTLPPKLFYDAAGSALFDEITRLPEYYPTRTEAAILTDHAEEICDLAGKDISLTELGAGTATKTRILLRALRHRQTHIDYFPLDVSDAALQLARFELEDEFDSVTVHPQLGDLENLGFLSTLTPPRLVLYIGSSIGNLDPVHAASLLHAVARQISIGDRLLLGVDLVKDPELLHQAYNDSAGVTAAFNKNLLVRINRELDGQFKPDLFKHVALWNEAESRIEMHLECIQAHKVQIGALDMQFAFAEGERIHTENSYKYTREGLQNLLREGGFDVEHVWTDPQQWFALSLGVIRSAE